MFLAFLFAATAAVLGVSRAHAPPLAFRQSNLFGFVAKIVHSSASYALIGAGVGALSRKQLLAALIVLAYFYFLEPLFMVIPGLGMFYPFLLGGATSALAHRTAQFASVPASKLTRAGPCAHRSPHSLRTYLVSKMDPR